MSKVWIADKHIFQERDGVTIFLFAKGAEVPFDIAVKLGLVEPETKKVAVDEVQNKAIAKPKGATSKKG